MTPTERLTIDRHIQNPTAENLVAAVMALCRDAAERDDQDKRMEESFRELCCEQDEQAEPGNET